MTPFDSLIDQEPPCRPLQPAIGRPKQNPDAAAVLEGPGVLKSDLQAAATGYQQVVAGTALVDAYDEAESIYVVVDGWMMMSRLLEDGRRQILGIAVPGDVVGSLAFEDGLYSYSIEAISNATVAVLPIKNIPALFAESPRLAMRLLSQTDRGLLQAFDALTDAGRRTAAEAVAHFLFRMATRVANTFDVDDKGYLPFPLTQEHIGDATGLTSVHVCRTMKALRVDGVVEIGRGKLRIVDREELAARAGIDDAWLDEDAAQIRARCAA